MSYGHDVIILDKSQAGGECAISIDGVKLEHVVSYSVQREAPGFATVTFTVHAGSVLVEHEGSKCAAQK
jgi:hypothetical protein